MPIVDPIIKQDLLLVKEAFETGAEKQEGQAIFLPLKAMMQSNRQIHENIKEQVARYPSSYMPPVSNTSLIDKIQAECIPCASRLKHLKDLDISFDLFYGLDAYNTAALQSMIDFYKNYEDRGFIETNICEIYSALKTNCIPDLQRVILALTMLLADIRNFDWKLLKDGFLNILVSVLSRLVVGFATGLDRYTRLITDTIRCMMNDVKYQIAKLDPILSGEGRRVTAKAFSDAWNKSSSQTNWLQKRQISRSVYSNYTAEKINQSIERTSTVFDQVNFATLKLNKVLKDGNKPLVALEALFNVAISRVELRLDGALQELLKLLKANTDNMDAMNKLYQQLNMIVEVIALVKALAYARDKDDKENPCGPEQGRRFFNEISIPGRTIYLIPPTEDSDRPSDDIDIVISKDPVRVDNPIVREVLENAGIKIKQTEDLKFEIDAEPITINFFACMKQARV